MLFRYYLTPAGRLGAFQYRHFLIRYWLFFLPGAILAYLSLIWIGIRYPDGAMRSVTFWGLEFGTFVYFGLCVWPLMACTLRRLHDLDLRIRDVIWILAPKESRALGRKMVHGRGTVGSNRFGPDPEESTKY